MSPPLLAPGRQQLLLLPQLAAVAQAARRGLQRGRILAGLIGKQAAHQIW